MKFELFEDASWKCCSICSGFNVWNSSDIADVQHVEIMEIFENNYQFSTSRVPVIISKYFHDFLMFNTYWCEIGSAQFMNRPLYLRAYLSNRHEDQAPGKHSFLAPCVQKSLASLRWFMAHSKKRHRCWLCPFVTIHLTGSLSDHNSCTFTKNGGW